MVKYAALTAGCRIVAALLSVIGAIQAKGATHPTGPGDAVTTKAKRTAIRQPLRVHPRNPRYFFDGVRGVYLGGHEIFVDAQDNTFNKEWTKDLSHPDDPGARAKLLDWKRYLGYVDRLGFNYVRGWIIWSTGSGKAAPPNKVAFPMPFKRTGPGVANDGGLKFDLHRFDDAFFRHLHDRARDLQRHGVYVSVMLFEPFGFLGGENMQGQRLWDGNLFHGANNVNGIDVDRNHNGLGEDFFSLQDPAIVKIQKAHVEKMADALNDLDNVLWELCNEPPSGSMEWQREMLRHLKTYEAGKRKQHLVLWSPGESAPEQELLGSQADFIATMNGWIDAGNRRVYPPRKPVMFDLDHIASGSSDAALIWKAFTRGYHFCLYDNPFEQPLNESSVWQVARMNVGLTCLLANRIGDMARMAPRGDLASTGYCLVHP